MRIKTLVLIVFFACHLSLASSSPEDLKLTFYPSNKGVKVSLENRGGKPQGIFPCLQEKATIPPFMWIKAVDSQNKTLTKFDFCPDAFYTPLARRSSYFTTPVKLDTLMAGEKREIYVSWVQLFSGVEPKSAQVNVRVKMRIYTDEELDKYIEEQSEWFTLNKTPQ